MNPFHQRSERPCSIQHSTHYLTCICYLRMTIFLDLFTSFLLPSALMGFSLGPYFARKYRCNSYCVTANAEANRTEVI